MGGKKFWSMHGVYNGIHFDSGFEKRFLEQCRQLGIKVTRSPDQVKYQDPSGKWHVYFPDFLWPDYKHTIEIKGTWAIRINHGFVKEKTAAALLHFKGRYTIFSEKDLKSSAVQDLYRKLHTLREK